MPDWLQTLSIQDAEAEAVEQEQAPTSDQVPDWLQELSQQPDAPDPASVARPAEGAAGETEGPDWLAETESELPDLVIDEQGERTLERQASEEPAGDVGLPDLVIDDQGERLVSAIEAEPAAEDTARLRNWQTQLYARRSPRARPSSFR